MAHRLSVGRGGVRWETSNLALGQWQDDYLHQMKGEQLRRVGTEYVWKRIHDNHAFDLEYYQVGLALAAGIRFDSGTRAAKVSGDG